MSSATTTSRKIPPVHGDPVPTALKKKWQRLLNGVPGERFQHIYANALRHRQNTPIWYRAVRLALAAVAFLLGLIFAVLPGPAFVFFILAGALLATESHAIAAAMDWCEVKIRGVLGWVHRFWKALSKLGKMGVIIGLAAAAGGAAYAMYRLFIAR